MADSPCWSCAYRKLVCNKGTVCANCARDNTTYNCTRVLLAGQLLQDFRRLSQRGHGWWILEDVDPKKPTLLARLKYEGQSQQPLRDLHTLIDSTTIAEEFLHQFVSFKASLSEHPLVRKHFGGITQQILSSAALFQLKWLLKPKLEYKSDENHLAMLALHCLIGTIELAELTQSHYGLLKLPTPIPDPMGGAYIKPELKEVTDPSKWPQDPPGKYPLVHTLQRVLQAAYRVLLRGNAEDWPLFYYTFFILRKTGWNLRQIQGLTTTVQGAGSKLYDDINVKLGAFAKYVTEGNESYRQEFDIKKYELLVSDPWLRKECVHLNKLWTAPLENPFYGMSNAMVSQRE